MSPAEALRTVQYRAQLRLDAIYADLTIDVRKTVERETDDHGHVDEGALIAALLVLLARARPLTAQVLVLTYAEALVAADPETAFVAPPVALYVAQLVPHDRNAVEQTLSRVTSGARAGLTSAALAKRAADYFSPWFSPRRDETGALKRADRSGAVTSWPGQAGLASAGARTLAQTEAAIAHGQATRGRARRERVRVRWRLSPGHRDIDRCDANARANVGFGAGVYPVDLLPPYPTHPRCRCTLEPV